MKLIRLNNAAIIWRSENELNKMKKNIIHWLDIECVNCFLVLFVLRGRRRRRRGKQQKDCIRWELKTEQHSKQTLLDWFSNLHFVSSYIFDFFIVSFFFFLFCFVMLLSSENYFRVFFCFPLRFFNLLFSLPSYPINCYCDINYEWLL